MRKIPQLILFLLILFSCWQKKQKPDIEKDTLVFKTSIYPAFIEGAEISLFKANDQQKIEFLLKEIQRDDRISDTFYFKTIALSKIQFNIFNFDLIQKALITKSNISKGIRDGIFVDFKLIHNNDTSQLHLDNPNIKTDSIGYQITKNAIDQFRILFADTIINDYLDDVESYIDNSKKGIRITDNRDINKLRKIEYSR